MFVLRYAEENNRKGSEPWSIRQCALYHQLRLSNHRSIYILISPYQRTEAEEMLVRWMQGLSTTDKYEHQLMRPAAMLLDSHVSRWRQYMKHYEREITKMVSSGKHEQDCETLLTSDLASGRDCSVQASSIPKALPRTI